MTQEEKALPLTELEVTVEGLLPRQSRAARRAYYDDEFSFLYGKGDVVKREYRTVLPVKSSGNVFCSEFFHVASVAQPPVPRHQYPGQKTEQEVRREADKADHQQAHENHIRCEEALAL